MQNLYQRAPEGSHRELNQRRFPRYNSPMMPEARVAAPTTVDEAAQLALQSYGLTATARPLPGEYDDNFHLLTADGGSYVLKIMHPARERSFVDMQCQALRHLASNVPHLVLPRVIPSSRGELFTCIDSIGRISWLLSFVPGAPLADAKPPRSPQLLQSLGRLLGEIDSALLTFSHSATTRDLKWDLSRALWARDYLGNVSNRDRRSLAAHFLSLFEQEVVPRLARLRRSVIYGDANDHNALLSSTGSNPSEVISVIDFGDMHTGLTAAEPAVAAAYAILGEENPLQAASAVLAGYHRIFPLNDEEIAAFFPLMAVRLAVSVINSAYRQSLIAGDPYVTVSESAAWAALERLLPIDSRQARATFRAAANGFDNRVLSWHSTCPGEEQNEASEKTMSVPRRYETIDESLAARKTLLGKNLSLSYDQPLKIVRGWMQYLYDDTGRALLDVYNNVPLVGHSHPRVVASIQEQLAVLNTNTRYLHDNILRYAERLTALLPAPLRVCYFLNSGSEANELALRLARTHTKKEDVIVLEHAYHGHTSTLIDISPYKFNGPGGQGRKSWVHVAPIPDDFRGIYRRGEANLGGKYAAHVAEILEQRKREGRGIAAFIAETLPSVAGQIVFPAGYLAEAYQHVRASGGVCIADEIQVGFGRLGSHFWGFESQGVVPDIVTLGKPIGNGFPLAAVVTTPEIADSFHNGMEFFSTFGGNPVACAAGLAVLDVLEDEHLQQNAGKVGSAWLRDLQCLQVNFPIIGDVRGAGLFLGVDFVSDPVRRTPATAQASRIVNRLRERGILAGTDGPQHNVLKLRPPLIFTDSDAALFTSTLASVLSGPSTLAGD